MAKPKPEKPASGSRTNRPIMLLLDLLGKRWALRILWELHQHQPCSFRKLQALCGNISPTVLNNRLAELREAGIVRLPEGEGYRLTNEGRSLCSILGSLNHWSKQWAKNQKNE